MRSLQLLESRYPFGKYAEQAQLELIYAHYKAYEHEAAVEAADRFIRLHPQHPNVDYAYYMKGLAAYTGNEDIFARFVPTDPTKRDTSHAKEAFAEFAQLVSRFPDSPYAADAKARMVSLRNLLARHEINVANYYFRRGAYLAATNRGRYRGGEFPAHAGGGRRPGGNGPGLYPAGMDDLAKDSIDVLALNYPEHSVTGQKRRVRQRLYAGRLAALVDQQGSFGLFDPPKPPQFDNRPTGLDPAYSPTPR